MTEKWLLIDSSFLGHRAFHSTGNLVFDGIATGVAFGFLREVASLMEFHDTANLAFCFDSGRSRREDMLPSYKSSRRKRYKEESPIEKKARKEMQRQVVELKNVHLRRIGFRNIFFESGYEADDLIASLCETINPLHEIVIVSADSDLYQLLNERTSLWNPAKKKFTTLQSFCREYHVYPGQWRTVKAIAGDATDDIPGVKGVGIKTAAKFVNGTLKTTAQAHQNIIAQLKRWQKNIKLVELPLKGTPELFLEENKLSHEGWVDVMKSLGIDSLDDLPLPGTLRRKRHGKRQRI